CNEKCQKRQSREEEMHVPIYRREEITGRNNSCDDPILEPQRRKAKEIVAPVRRGNFDLAWFGEPAQIHLPAIEIIVDHLQQRVFLAEALQVGHLSVLLLIDGILIR